MTEAASPAFPRNAWYATAWDHEVRRALLARTICNKQLVLYRTERGEAVALEDACWHRLVPLSLGKLIGDDVECGYHGLVFGPHGRCVKMPSQETLNPSACVRRFPVAERHRLLWIWMGDPALADAALVPDLHWLDDDAWVGDGRTLAVRCDYRLIVDNLMDLTHEAYVHQGSIGQNALAHAPFDVEHGDRTATVRRWMIGVTPPPFWAGQLGQYGAVGQCGTDGRPVAVDRWQIIHFEAPCTIAIDVGVCPTGSGAPEGDRSQGVNGYVLNTITPETDRSCHYFWGFARNYALRRQGLTAALCAGVERIFAEDLAILEAQQRAIDAHPDCTFQNLNIDAGGLWARRLIDRLIAAETRRPLLKRVV